MKMLFFSEVAERDRPLDLLRVIAVGLVLCFHFQELIPWGFLGVDVFFVLSGYLVSKPLLMSYLDGGQVNWKFFIVKRFFKIVPSYLFFLATTFFIAYFFIMPDFPLEIIQREELPPFLFLYVNYTGTLSWIFGHVWTLCIEEHFYLLLPLLVVVCSTLKRYKKIDLLIYVFVLLICLTWILRLVGFYNEWDTIAKTHMRLDALIWGVLIAMLEMNGSVAKCKRRYVLISFGVVALCLWLTWILCNADLFNKVILHGFIAVQVAMILILFIVFNPPIPGLFSRFSMYSYNWYLWHPIIAFALIEMSDFPYLIKFGIYIASSFVVAVLTTELVERPFLRIRDRIIQKLKA